MKYRNRILAGGLAASLALTLAACAPGKSGDDSPKDYKKITKPVTEKQVKDLGNVKLNVWADAGEEDTIKRLIPKYEKAYPNVKVKVTYKGWDDLMSTVVNAAASDNPPDVFNGNQGYATMGTMVAGNMVRPLDDVVKAYKLDEGVPESGWDPVRWNKAGTQWGKGSVMGLAGATQPLGLFSNSEKLKKLGIKTPTNITELDAALKKAKKAGETPIQLGNSDKYPLGSHVLGILIDLYSTPEEVNSWVSGKKGATFNTPGVHKAISKLQEWNKAGYFPKGYNGRSLDDSVAAFGKGDGVFFLGGSFNGAKLAKYNPKAFQFTLLANDKGTQVTTGTFGTPWHISSKSKVQSAAIAFVGMMMSKDFGPSYAKSGRLPIYGLDEAKAVDPVHQSELDAARTFFKNGDFVGYLDWASSTMQDTLGSGAQQMLSGQMSADEFIKKVQKDWSTEQSKRASS
jgi:raffinose/stachyose/melibiose transport system substrate-binding protein